MHNTLCMKSRDLEAMVVAMNAELEALRDRVLEMEADLRSREGRLAKVEASCASAREVVTRGVERLEWMEKSMTRSVYERVMKKVREDR